MDDRLNAWLDGEIDDAELTSAERDEALRLGRTMRLAADAERVTGPGLTDAVMARLAGAPVPRRGLLDRVRATLVPRPLPLRPAFALAAACLILGFGIGIGVRPDAPAAPVAATAGAPTVFVRFDLQVDGARTVQLAGSFSGWEPAYELSPAGDGRWTVTVPLAPGVHDYVFVVDGERNVLDPAAPRIADGFGTYSNRIALLASAT